MTLPVIPAILMLMSSSFPRDPGGLASFDCLSFASAIAFWSAGVIILIMFEICMFMSLSFDKNHSIYFNTWSTLPQLSKKYKKRPNIL